MSGKFMSVKRIVIPTITMIIIASQLMGCAAATQSEMLQMINQGEAIEIEIANPINQEEGTEISVEWIQLDKLTSQPNLRKSMDDIFKIVPFGENSKNGIFYVNLAGEQDGNNTLYNVFANSKFRDNYWNNVAIQSDIAESAANNYADIEYEEGYYQDAVLAAINGYFNILNDSSDGYANMDSTITRLEAMAAIFKAENPVTDNLSEDAEFNAAVDSSNTNEYTVFASNLSEQSYLDISSGSLDNMTANGTITRGELAYMLVQQYFKADYDKADPKATCYSDAVNGGNIAQEQKFIEDATSKPHWQSYELSYAINNPDKGCPERMYKALVVAFDKGIITGSECRCDEGVTKADLLEMLTNAYLAMPTQISAEQGEGEESVIIEEETTETEVLTGDEISLEDIPDDVQEAMDEIDKALSDNNTKESTNVSELAGTTSKHGYVYADDFNERGKRYEDRRGRLEQRFDQGMITEEQYQQSLKLLESTKDNGSGTPSMEDVVKAIDEATNPDPVDGSTTPGGGATGGGSSNPPGTPGYDPATYIPEGNTYHPDGILCY